jgi:hypothetical protein
VVAWTGWYQTSVFEDATQAIRQIGPGGLEVTEDGQWLFGGQERDHLASGSADYILGPRLANSSVDGVFPNATGSRWLIAVSDAGYRNNTVLFLADVDAVPEFVVGKPSPTVLSWDASPFSTRYDVVRGSVSNLSIAGTTVSLGAVTCLEDDSPDNHTLGYADPAEPAPGEAFFWRICASPPRGPRLSGV